MDSLFAAVATLARCRRRRRPHRRFPSHSPRYRRPCHHRALTLLASANAALTSFAITNVAADLSITVAASTRALATVAGRPRILRRRPARSPPLPSLTTVATSRRPSLPLRRRTRHRLRRRTRSPPSPPLCLRP